MADNAIRISIVANAKDAIRQINATAKAVDKMDRQAKADGLRKLARDAAAATKATEKLQAAAKADGLRKMARQEIEAATAAKKLKRDLDAAARAAEKLNGNLFLGKATAVLKKDLTSVSKAMGGVTNGVAGMLKALAKIGGKALGYSLMGFIAVGVASGAAQVASALSAGLLAALPAVGVLPAFALAAASAFTVLKVATSGLGDAMKLGLAAAASGATKDIIAYNAALDKLAPAAQAVVKQFVALNPALIAVRNAIAGKFFAGFSAELKLLAGTYLPLLSTHGQAVAKSLGKAALSIGAFAREGRTVKSVAKTLGFVATAIDNVSAGVKPLVRGLLPLFTVSASFLPKMTSGFKAVADQFAAFMTAAEKSGALKGFIQGGLDALKALFGIMKNVGSILKSVFVDANKGAGGFFTVIGTVIKQVADFLNTADGMKAIGAIWGVLRQVGTALGDALKVVLPAFGKALVAIAPAIGPLTAAMSQFLIALSPILPIAGKLAAVIGIELAKVFVILAPVLLEVGKTLGVLLTALAPMLPVVATLAATLGTALVAGVKALLPALVPLIKAAVGFLAGLAPLLPIIGKLAALIGAQLAKVLIILAPVIVDVAKTIGKLLTAVAPILPVIAKVAAVIGKALVGAVEELLPAVAPLVKALGAGLLAVITALAPLLLPLATLFAKIVTAVTPLIAPITALVAQFLTGLLPVIVQLMPSVDKLLGALGPALIQVIAAVAPTIPQLTDSLLELVPPFIALVDTIVPLIPKLSYLAGLFLKYLLPAISGTTMVILPLIKVGTPLVKMLSDIADAVVLAVKNVAGSLTDILGQAGDLVALLADIGGKIVDGLLGGLQAGWHKVTDWFGDAVNLIPDKIQKILGIKSPSTVMAAIGINIGKGLAGGIKAQVPAIAKVMDTVAGVVSGGVATTAAVKLNATAAVVAPPVTATTTPVAGYQINITVAPGADPSEAGRQTVAAIEAYERQTGRKRLLVAV